jgi:hypothetical protein
MFNKANVVGFIALAALLAGCEKPPITPQAELYPAGQINMSSEEVKDLTAVGMPQVSRDPVGNLVIVSVPIRAATDKRLYVDYRVHFFDRDHIELYQTSWLPKTLEPNTPDQVTVESTTPKAADFQIDFRLADQ